MRCVECGAEMILVNVVQRHTTAAGGLEDHCFKCSGCKEVKQRLVLTRHGREIDTTPDIVPISTVRDDQIADLLRCVLAKIRDVHVRDKIPAQVERTRA
jgi:hypothetical protein